MNYEINGKIFKQKPLVLGQVRQILPIFKGLSMPNTTDMTGFVEAIGDKMPHLLAIVLVEEGTDIRQKNLEELASFLEFNITAEQTIQSVEDFFGCNPIASLLGKLSGMMNLMTAKIGSKQPASTFQEATSQNETQSCGDARRVK